MKLPALAISFGFTLLLHIHMVNAEPAKEEVSAKTTASKVDADMQRVLDAHASLNPKPIPTLAPQEARQQPTPSDAVTKVLTDAGKSAEPVPVASVTNMEIPGTYGSIPTYVYTPKGKGPFPVIVYFHGGGFVIAGTAFYDASIRGLANGAEAVVVSIDYRLAPENKFPIQPNEAYDTYKWVLKNASKITLRTMK